MDSSTVVSLMQAQSNRPVKTFTIGFYEDAYNEAKYAKQVAAHLGTDHTELYLTPEQTFEVIPKIPDLYDEPFSDSSQIPTFLVSALARQQVTVSLSGDGGDELFGGYHRYFLGRSVWEKVGWLPYGVRHSASRAMCQMTPKNWSRLFNLIRPLLPTRFGAELRGNRMHAIAEMLAAKNQEDFYKQLVSCWKRPTELVLGAEEPTTTLTDANHWADLPSFLQRMMFLDLVTYLPDCILTKVDRASMGVSLEARVPLLDHRVVEFAARIPVGLKVYSGKGKQLLRQLLYRYVPKELVDRRKMGFGIPLGVWLRGPLRGWAEDLLDNKRMQREGYLRPEHIRRIWADHLVGDRDWGYYLWTVLTFESWLDHWMGRDVRRPQTTSQLVLQ